MWLTLLKARAIENQCFVAAANRIGIDGEGISYCGDSLVAGPKGETIADAGREESLLSAEISLDNLENFRRSFPMLNDADKFEIKF